MLAERGSSPLARGTRRLDAAQARARRFIPTRAGNTSPSSSVICAIPVHPHSRGEHRRRPFLWPAASGSSPLARGTRRATASSTARGRFIPTRAGNTEDRPGVPDRLAVHPHSRGEHLEVVAHGGAQVGSSPLARGTRTAQQSMVLAHRFIPTRAGNTNCTECAGSADSVHPHSRGEHGSGSFLPPIVGGSSPLARGTPSRP